MQFTTSIITAILATSVYAAPRPTYTNSNDTKPYNNVPTTTSPAPAVDTLLTQKLFLADTAADRFKLLPVDSQFVFNFNKVKGAGGKGGDLFAANRKTFPALVGTNSGMAVGFLGPCGFNTPHVHPRATELQIVVDGRVVTEVRLIKQCKQFWKANRYTTDGPRKRSFQRSGQDDWTESYQERAEQVHDAAFLPRVSACTV